MKPLTNDGYVSPDKQEREVTVKRPEQYSAVGWLLEKKKREIIEKEVMNRMKD